MMQNSILRNVSMNPNLEIRIYNHPLQTFLPLYQSKTTAQVLLANEINFVAEISYCDATWNFTVVFCYPNIRHQ